MSRRRRLPWLVNQRVGWALLWTVALIGVFSAINLVGIHLLGGIAQWEQWMAAHAGHFLAWRAGVYAALGAVWLRVRKRLVNAEAPLDAQVRLLRAEIAAVVAIVVLESAMLLRAP